MKNQTDNTPKIYVGTYAKYNNGSINGAWLDLSDYSSKEEFYQACAELHKDETDPEFMFQDWENIPDSFIGESWLADNVFEYFEAMEDVSDSDAFEAYVLNEGDLSKQDIAEFVERFNEAYAGEFDSDEKFADNLAEEIGYFDAMEKAGISLHYFDSSAFARDLLCGDYWTSGGYYFRNI